MTGTHRHWIKEFYWIVHAFPLCSVFAHVFVNVAPGSSDVGTATNGAHGVAPGSSDVGTVTNGAHSDPGVFPGSCVEYEGSQ